MTYKLIVQVFPHHIEVSECPDFILHLLEYIFRGFLKVLSRKVKYFISEKNLQRATGQKNSFGQFNRAPRRELKHWRENDFICS